MTTRDDLPHPVSARDRAPGALVGIDPALIHRVVHGFYDEIRADALLGPIFMARIPEARWPAHLANMVEFWSSVLLMSGSYKGKPVPAHAPLPIDDPHFAHWLDLFEGVVTRLCTPAAAALFMDRAERIAASLRYAIKIHQAEPGAPLVFPAPLQRGKAG